MRPLYAFALLLSACGPEGPATATLGQGRYTVLFEDRGRALTLLRDGAPLLSVPPDGFVVGTAERRAESQSYDPYWMLLGKSTPPDWRSPEGARLEVAGDTAQVALFYPGGVDATLTVTPGPEGRFALSLQPGAGAEQVVLFRLAVRAGASEGFYGTGERPDAVEQRGRLRPMQIELDADLESKNDESHVPVPLLVGTRGWGLFVESRRVGALDIARDDPERIDALFAAGDEPFRVHLFAAEHPLDVYRHYYQVTGLPRLPAPWALGPLVWRNETRDQAQLLDDIAQLRARDLATTGLWIDRPYASAVNTFDFDPARYPDPAQAIRVAHDAGLRVGLWHAPYLEETAQPQRGAAEAMGYFPPKSGILLNNWSQPIDLTNPAAYAFWQAELDKYRRAGIEGYKLDYGEDIVPSVPPTGRNVFRFADGSDERTMHHGYTLLYHRVYGELIPERGGFLLCRAGRWGDQTQASLIWPGDMDATFTKHRERFLGRDGHEVVGVGGLPATIIMGSTLSASGFPFFGADTGGYRHSPPDRELWIRWVEQTALSVVMQVGDASSQMPWEYNAENGRDDAALDIYRTYARLHLRLVPYLERHVAALHGSGRPILRPFGLAHPELGRHPDDEYLLADDLLVAPVITRGATSRRVVFPPGAWVDWWDGTHHPGGSEAEVAAPIDRLPLFVREGAIVELLRPTIDTLSPVADPAAIDSLATAAGPLHPRVVPPATGSVTVGTLTVARESGGLRVSHGDAGPMQIEVLGWPRPATVTAGGAALAEKPALAELETGPGWFWEAARGGTLFLRLLPGPAAEVR